MNKQTKWRKKQRDNGLVPFECWCRPQDRAAIRAFAKILRTENIEFAGFSAYSVCNGRYVLNSQLSTYKGIT